MKTDAWLPGGSMETPIIILDFSLSLCQWQDLNP